jgi:hypothetical protein
MAGDVGTGTGFAVNRKAAAFLKKAAPKTSVTLGPRHRHKHGQVEKNFLGFFR